MIDVENLYDLKDDDYTNPIEGITKRIDKINCIITDVKCMLRDIKVLIDRIDELNLQLYDSDNAKATAIKLIGRTNETIRSILDEQFRLSNQLGGEVSSLIFYKERAYDTK